MNSFKPDWEEWMNLNISLGNCKLIMFQKSLEAGYNYDLIKNKLNIEYHVSKPMPVACRDKIALRNAVRIPSNKLEIYEIVDFLTQEECTEVIKIINDSNLQSSSTINVADVKNYAVNEYRTSKTCHFYNTTPFINEIESRICKTIGINNRNAELIQGQKYEIGQQFKIHTDYFDAGVLKNDPSIRGQRTWTFMIYLNDLVGASEAEEEAEQSAGGYTSFPYAYIATKPKAGTAIIWNNLTNDKKENIYSSHCGMPILKGEKYILTQWFKDQEINLSVQNEICEHHFLPIFHPTGFEKLTLRLDCIDEIKAWMKENEDQFVSEPNATGDVEKHMKSNFLDINRAPPALRTNLLNEMRQRLTKWIGYKSTLRHVSTYGIREYTRGSSLENHYDKKNTHVISAIIHLEDTSDTPWPLYIEDHNFKPHEVTMEYGDVIFYESTTCLHGRPRQFEGDSYKNMYIHFSPERWSDYTN
jgi:prolyl 4-hydroxylase